MLRHCHKNMIKGAIFDLDGTLIDSMDYHHRAYLEALKGLGIRLSKKEFIKLVGIPARGILKIILQKHHRLDLLDDVYMTKYIIAAKNIKLIKLNSNIRPLLKWLKSKKIKMALATSSDKKFAHQVLKNNRIEKYFQVILGWQDAVHPKPSPDIFLEAQNRLGLRKSECLVIEDAEIGILAGKRSGIKTIALVGTNTYSTLKKMRPDYIIKNALEIKKLI